MSRTTHHRSDRRFDRAPRKPVVSESLASLLAELDDADFALNVRTWGAAPTSSTQLMMVAALEVAATERMAA